MGDDFHRKHNPRGSAAARCLALNHFFRRKELVRFRERYHGRARERNRTIRTKDSGRFRVVTNRNAPIRGFVLDITQYLAVAVDLTTRPVQETPHVVDDSAIEGEVKFFK